MYFVALVAMADSLGLGCRGVSSFQSLPSPCGRAACLAVASSPLSYQDPVALRIETLDPENRRRGSIQDVAMRQLDRSLEPSPRLELLTGLRTAASWAYHNATSER